jgi:hypothetical protein
VDDFLVERFRVEKLKRLGSRRVFQIDRHIQNLSKVSEKI